MTTNECNLPRLGYKPTNITAKEMKSGIKEMKSLCEKADKNKDYDWNNPHSAYNKTVRQQQLLKNKAK